MFNKLLVLSQLKSSRTVIATKTLKTGLLQLSSQLFGKAHAASGIYVAAISKKAREIREGLIDTKVHFDSD